MNIKLDNLSFHESSKNLFRSFLTNRRQSVILQDCISDETTPLRGVPKEKALGPPLFNLFTTDMATRVDKEPELIQNAEDTGFNLTYFYPLTKIS